MSKSVVRQAAVYAVRVFQQKEKRMRFALFILVLLFVGCELKERQSIAAPPSSFEDPKPAPPPEPPPEPPPPKTIKSKPTWVMRSFKDWLQVSCSRDGSECAPMGRVTMLVEFVHNGCQEIKRLIDSQAELVQGYAAEHQFVVVIAASDALTRTLYDTKHTYEPPCRVFLYDDTLKPDQKMPNEDQRFVELCKDVTVITESECRSQLFAKKLYAP